MQIPRYNKSNLIANEFKANTLSALMMGRRVRPAGGGGVASGRPVRAFNYACVCPDGKNLLIVCNQFVFKHT